MLQTLLTRRACPWLVWGCFLVAVCNRGALTCWPILVLACHRLFQMYRRPTLRLSLRLLSWFWCIRVASLLLLPLDNSSIGEICHDRRSALVLHKSLVALTRSFFPTNSISRASWMRTFIIKALLVILSPRLVMMNVFVSLFLHVVRNSKFNWLTLKFK